jgi:hypothetical protein
MKKDLIDRIKLREINITPEQRRQRLINAHILDINGHFDSNYFSIETVNLSKTKKESFVSHLKDKI